jgi:hypothetical protein
MACLRHYVHVTVRTRPYSPTFSAAVVGGRGLSLSAALGRIGDFIVSPGGLRQGEQHVRQAGVRLPGEQEG